MPKYLMLSSLTSEGGQTFHANPDRVKEVNKEIKNFGCKIDAQYALLGPYDFATIIDAPNNETAAHLSVDLSSRGTVSITTLPAIPINTLVKKMKTPHKLGRTHR